jgi:hypothetical protein
MIRKLCSGLLDHKIHRVFGPRPQAPKPLKKVPQNPHIERIRKLKEVIDMDNVNESLEKIMNEVSGALGTALVDHESGMCLGTMGSGIDLEVAAAGNMEVVRAKMKVMKDLGIEGSIEDILITLADQYHIIRPVKSSLFLYLAINRSQGNLAMARRKLASVGETIVV